MKYQTMDVILFKPRKWNLFGRLIAWITNSPFSHVGIILDGDLEQMVEATVRVRSVFMGKDKRDFTVFRYQKELLPGQVLAGRKYLVSMLRSRYDFGNLVDIFINLFRRAFNRPYRVYFQKDGRPVCSELVARAFGAMGETPFYGKALWAVTPADIPGCGLFKKVGGD